MNMVCRSIRPPVPIDLERVQKLLYSSRPKHHYSDVVNRLEAVLSNREAAVRDFWARFPTLYLP